MRNFKCLELPYNPSLRGVDGCQAFPRENDPEIARLSEYLILNNDFYSNVGSEIPFNFTMNINLEKSARLTDFLCIGNFNEAMGILLSDKVRNIFERFTIIDGKYFKVNMWSHDGSLIDETYYWFYPHRLVAPIDFSVTSQKSGGSHTYTDERSFLRLRKSRKALLKEINDKFPFNNPEKYLEINAVDQSASPSKYYVDAKKILKYDFVTFKYNTTNFISDALIKELKRNHISGYEIDDDLSYSRIGFI